MRTAALTRLGMLAIATVALSTGLASTVQAAPQPVVPEPGPVVTGQWIVGVSGPPVARGGDAAQIGAAQNGVLGQARSQGISVLPTRAFGHAYNGITVQANARAAAQLRSLPGVTGVWPVYRVDAPNPQPGSTPDLADAVKMTGADIVQSQLGFTGHGVKVGIIDSGIDIDHPDLGGTGKPGTTAFPTTRVKWGTDLVGDAYDANGTTPDQTTPRPDPVPDDCGGHGTHVAGIVGAAGNPASGGVRGVAPQAELGAYRIFGCHGSTTTEIILAAMDRALPDGMDVVNMSLSLKYMSWPTYPTAAAVDALTEAGVAVICSAGNEGGAFTVGSPGSAAGAITVGSVNNKAIKWPMFTITPDGRQIAMAVGRHAAPAPTTGELRLVAASPNETPDPNTGCSSMGDVAGKAVLVSVLGNCTYYDKALRAQKAGAKAVVNYNDWGTPFTPWLDGPEPITIPVVEISQADSQVILERLAKGPVSLQWSPLWHSVPDYAGGVMADTSSYGLGADLSLKPDLSAPGANILSTYPLEKQRYANLSGTSMAAPHVAGAVALYLESNRNWPVTPQAIRERLQSTAQLVPAHPEEPTLAAAHRQGGGMLKIDRAIQTQQTVTPGKISLGEGAAGPRTVQLTISNNDSQPVAYRISKQDGMATIGTSSPAMQQIWCSAGMSAPSLVHVPAQGSATIRVTITPPATPEQAVYGGWVVLSAPGATTLRVPFAGLVGDYQSVKMFSGINVPTLGQGTGQHLKPLPRGASATYTMVNGDLPTLIAHLDYPTGNLWSEIYRVDDQGDHHLITPGFTTWFQTGPTGRDPAPHGVPHVFDGTFPGPDGKPLPVPNGKYVFVLKALKPLGDPANPAHTETWTSPVFTIKRAG